MPKRILIFSTAYYPFVGGAEVAVKEITDRISDMQFDLITAKLRHDLPFKEKIGNVTVFRLGIGVPLIDKLILPFEGALFARHLQKKQKYDAYWCMMATFASGAAYILNIFSKNKVPIVLSLQEGDSERHSRVKWFGLIDLSWKSALKRTSVVTAISSYLANRAKRLGCKGEVKVIPNGVDIQNFTKDVSQGRREEIRRKLGIKNDDIILVTASRLVPKNGLEYVIRALPRLPANIKFLVLGEGPLEAKLQGLSADLGVEGRVIFGGFIDHLLLNEYLRASDIFIRPSLSEGLGNSFIEAMAAGLLVVATPVGGIVDFLHDPTSQGLRGTSGQTGYFCKPGNPESITVAINRCISDPNKDAIIQNAKKMVIEKYNWRAIAMQMKEVFDSM